MNRLPFAYGTMYSWTALCLLLLFIPYDEQMFSLLLMFGLDSISLPFGLIIGALGVLLHVTRSREALAGGVGVFALGTASFLYHYAVSAAPMPWAGVLMRLGLLGLMAWPLVLMLREGPNAPTTSNVAPDPNLARLMNPQHPGDLQVAVHQGGPKTSQTPPELCWVHHTGRSSASTARHIYHTGILLNQPTHIAGYHKGQEVTFIAPQHGDAAVLTTPEYRAERDAWHIRPCEACGFSELMDAPSKLASVSFPDAPAGSTPIIFTTRCGICGSGRVGLELVNRPDV